MSHNLFKQRRKNFSASPALWARISQFAMQALIGALHARNRSDHSRRACEIGFRPALGLEMAISCSRADALKWALSCITSTLLMHSSAIAEWTGKQPCARHGPPSRVRPTIRKALAEHICAPCRFGARGKRVDAHERSKCAQTPGTVSRRQCSIAHFPRGRSVNSRLEQIRSFAGFNRQRSLEA